MKQHVYAYHSTERESCGQNLSFNKENQQINTTIKMTFTYTYFLILYKKCQ